MKCPECGSRNLSGNPRHKECHNCDKKWSPEVVEIKDHFEKDKTLLVYKSEIEQQALAWDELMKLAEKAGLIAMAGGGNAILIHPREQVREGHYHRIQWMSDNKHRCMEDDQG